MNDAPAERLVDARGMRCPWPALRLARAVREGPAGRAFRLLADDPNAGREIAALAAAHGWEITAILEGYRIQTGAISTSPLPNRG